VTCVFFARSSCSCSPLSSTCRGFEFLLGKVSDGLQQRRGQFAGARRTVRVLPRTVCYSGSSLEVLFAFSDSPRRKAGRSAVCVRTVRGCPTDSPRAPADGLLFGVVSGGSVCFFRQSAAQGRTVRGVCADSPRQQAGRSAWPMRTVRPSWPDGPPEPECFVLWFDSFFLLSCFRVCFKESFLRLEVDP
jgi:hypothetical protein